MIANQTANPALFVIADRSPRRPDPVKARVNAPSQVTNFEALQARTTASSHGGLHLLEEGSRAERRRPHPADVLYWAACLGGVCLLLLSATT